jgi:xanthine/CO dehydrogenase XdhC/CoxF family maturation factor
MIEESLARVVPARRAVARGSRRNKRWWLIAKNENGRVEFLTTCHDEDSEESLVVFGHEEEAEMFVYLGGYGDGGWHARESSSGEMVSVLYGPCSGAEGVALDPLAGMVACRTLSLVRLRRARFLDQLLGHPH